MISCDKASHLCNKAQYKEATFIERLKLRYHLFVCKTCSAFTKKNTELTTLCDKADLKSFSQQEKDALREQLKQQN